MKVKIIPSNDNLAIDQGYVDKVYTSLDFLVNGELNIQHNFTNKSENTLDGIITQLFIGSKRIRFGNYPSDLCFNSLQNLIRKKIAHNEPIPIIVPMGPHKTVINECIDLAEIYALKTLSALHSRVCKYYPSGLIFYLREEDIIGWFLTGTSIQVRENIGQYLSSFNKLIKILGYEKFIVPFRESQMVEYKDVLALIDIYSEPIRNYIHETNGFSASASQQLSSYRVLKALGWKGEIPAEQRTFYRERYTKHYPEKTTSEIDEMMVNYLAISFAKSQLGALVPKETKNDYIQLTFAPPVPGIPKDIASKRVHYRTLPSNISRMHLPFWRAKGFLSIDNNEVRPAINNWYDKQQFHKHKIKLISNTESVILRADIGSKTYN